jgi:hypothetical protein
LLLDLGDAGVELASKPRELGVPFGEPALHLRRALHRRRETLLQLRELALASDVRLRHELLVPADDGFALAQRLLALVLCERLLTCTQRLGIADAHAGRSDRSHAR